MAKEFSLSVPHSLPQEQALARIKSLMVEARSNYGSELSEVVEQWDGYRCRFKMKMGVFPFSGIIDVGAAAVQIQAKMPIGTGRYEQRAKALIEQRVAILLNPKPDLPPSDTIAGPPPTFRL